MKYEIAAFTCFGECLFEGGLVTICSSRVGVYCLGAHSKRGQFEDLRYTVLCIRTMPPQIFFVETNQYF